MLVPVLFLLFLKETVGGGPDLFDIGHALCDGAWVGTDKNSGCHQLIIPRSKAYFWVSGSTRLKGIFTFTF